MDVAESFLAVARSGTLERAERLKTLNWAIRVELGKLCHIASAHFAREGLADRSRRGPSQLDLTAPLHPNVFTIGGVPLHRVPREAHRLFPDRDHVQYGTSGEAMLTSSSSSHYY